MHAERIRQGRDAGATAPFVHFHDVYELVLFGAVEGHFMTEARRYALAPRSVVFVPPMRQHDFALARGPRDWILIQIDATAGVSPAYAPTANRLREPFCARPGRVLHQRLIQLAGWLAELESGAPLRLPLARALLHAITLAPVAEGEPLETGRAGLQRLWPAVDLLRRDPAHAPGGTQAARLCAMSSAYFSRRFKQQVGVNWSEYVRVHRLRLASRRLLETDQSIAAIAIDLGFATPSHFGRLFHAHFGMTPKSYRRKGRDPGA